MPALSSSLNSAVQRSNHQMAESEERSSQNVPKEVGIANKDPASLDPSKEEGKDEEKTVKETLEAKEASTKDKTESTSPSSLPGYLPWEEDMEMVSKYLDRKDELEDSHKEYLCRNPELKAVLADFLQAVLIQKPSDIYDFAREFFRPFGANARHQPSFPSHRVPEILSDNQ